VMCNDADKRRLSKDDKKSLDGVKIVIDDINTYLQSCRGKFESAVETAISTEPINAKHNPFFSGSFNGADCMRLLKHNAVMMNAISECVDSELDEETQNAGRQVVSDFETVFQLFYSVVKTFRSTRKLTEEEQSGLLSDIKKFGEAYFSKTIGSQTPKLHHLFNHVHYFLVTYGTVGFFAEDAVESIHAIFNTNSRRFAALPSKKRAHQVFMAASSRKDKDRKLKQFKKDDDETMEKKKRVRKTRKDPEIKKEVENEHIQQPASFADAIAEEIGRLTMKLDQIRVQLCVNGNGEQSIGEEAEETGENRDEAAEHEHLNLPELVMQETSLCPICRDGDTDTLLPDILMGIHKVMVHTDVGEKFIKNK
jgi:hypothetical protein